jgi:3D (Asp-Asp-Asp) domain-containing protein
MEVRSVKKHKNFLQFITLVILVLAFLIVAVPQEKISEEKHAFRTIQQSSNLINQRVSLINVDGQEVFVRTDKETVADILAEAPVVINPDDKTLPALEAIAEEKIQVIRVTKKRVEEKSMLAYSTEERPSEELFKGETRILQKGEKGIEKSIYEIILEDGKEVARNFVEKVLVKEPVTQIVAMGTRQVVSRGGNTLEFTEARTMTATAYTHTGNKTYTGVWPSVGTVAVDPKVIPLGTRLYIDGYGYGTAMDIGSSIKGNRIDVFMDTKEEALRWGRRQVKVFVLSNK